MTVRLFFQRPDDPEIDGPRGLCGWLSCAEECLLTDSDVGPCQEGDEFIRVAEL